MANLNENDILFLGSPEFAPFSELLEDSYKFKILSYDIPPLASFTSRKVVLNTDAGVYFLKEKPQYCSDSVSLACAAEFQDHLSASLKNVPPILKTHDGSPYVQWRGRYFFLSEFRPGRVFNGTDSDIAHMLVALRDFHAVAQSFKVSNARPVKSYETLRFFNLVQKKVTTKDERDQLAKIETVVNKLIRKYESVPRTPHTMSHGDFALFNILIEGEGVIAINDFDNVAYFPRVHDLAEFLVSASMIHYLGPISNLRSPVFLRPNEKTFTQILTFYSRHFSLSSDEICLLAIVAEIVWLELLLLAVLKEDYSVFEIAEAVTEIEKGTLQAHILREMEARRKKIFIWDFHGTLEMGTSFILTEVANTLLQEHGSTKQYTPAEIACMPSFSWNTFFQKHFPDKSSDQIEKIAQSAYDEKRFGYLMDKYSHPNIGAETTLRFIKENGGVNIVVSHSRQDKLGHYIRQTGLEHLIDEYHGIDDGTIASREDVVKKKASVIRELLDQHNGCGTFAVGDADMDFNAARAAGVDRFYWLLPANNKGTKQLLYKGIDSNKLKFVLRLQEITQDV